MSKSTSFLRDRRHRYECRTFWFPIFEVCRRLILSAVVAVFYPGSMQQVIVALLGAILSGVVYAYYAPYIEDDDEVVSAVAQAQLVLIYVAAVAAYASDAADSAEIKSSLRPGHGSIIKESKI